MTAAPAYRPEIDGLRAVAIAAVLVHHAGVPIVPGGYLGVDLFFVISGFVITRLILAERQADAFSFRRFWARRARRILPALLALLAVILPVAWVILTPDQWASFLPVFLGAATMVPNVMLWLDVGYFSPAAETQLLLHTWSLGVEEQFYLIFPLLLIALLRVGVRWTAVALAGLALASFGLALVVAGSAPWAGFYLLPSRAWELLAGALVAVLPQVGGRLPAQLLMLVGLELVILPMLLFGEVGPGYGTLPVVVGAAMVLAATGRETLGGRLLAAPVMVFLGKVSFGTYLWHLPLLVVPRIVLAEELPLAVNLGLMALSVGLGWLSWRLVETPFRRAERPVLPGAGAGAGVLAMVGISALGLAALEADRLGWRDRAWPGIQPAELAALWDERSGLVGDGTCHLTDETVAFAPFLDGWRCGAVTEAAGARPVAVFGDSIAADLAMTLRTLGHQPMQLTGYSCAIVPSAMRPDCRILADRLQREARAAGITSLILGNSWHMTDPGPRALREVEAYWGQAFETVVVLGPPPLFARLEERLLRWPALRLAAAEPEAGRRPAFLDAVPALAADGGPAPGVTYVDTGPLFCGDRPGCSVLADGPLMLDHTGHLTRAGAAVLARGLDRAGVLEALAP